MVYNCVVNWSYMVNWTTMVNKCCRVMYRSLMVDRGGVVDRFIIFIFIPMNILLSKVLIIFISLK